MSEIDTAGVPSWGCVDWAVLGQMLFCNFNLKYYQNLSDMLEHLAPLGSSKVTVLPLLKMDVLGVVAAVNNFLKATPICEHIVHQDANGEQVS